MFDLAGITSLATVFLIVFILSLYFKSFAKIILAALILRILLLIINNNFFYLPDGNMDGLTFEFFAWEWSQDGFINVFKHYHGPNTYFLSFLLAIPYSLLGRSYIMAQSFTILFGVINILLVCLIARKLWNNKIALNAGWFAAFFPSAASYSVLFMRETYIAFFLLLAFFHIINFFEHKNLKSFLFVLLSFIGASFFHLGSIFGLIAFLGVLGFMYIKLLLKKLYYGKVDLNNLLVIIVVFFILQSSGLKIPNEYLDLDRSRVKVINTKLNGDAAYPEWAKINSNIEYLYKAPTRMVYFILSPFPWDIKSLKHIVGLFDSLFYFFLTFLIFRNLKNIKNDQALITILIILLSYLFVFGLGVGNFGTAIRHRVKFAFWMILLAAPLIPKLVLFKEKIIKNKK
jgi:hypothetical protein